MRTLVIWVITVCFSCSQSIMLGQQRNSPNAPGALLFEGLVYGYHLESTRRLLTKSYETVLEGTLDHVDITTYVDTVLISKNISNKRGEFAIRIRYGCLNRIEFYKKGYEKSILLVDTRGIPEKFSNADIHFSNSDIMLINGNEENQEPFGTLHYVDKRKQFDFIANEEHLNKGKKGKADNQVKLIQKSVHKNKNIFVLYDVATSKRNAVTSKSVMPIKKDTIKDEPLPNDSNHFTAHRNIGFNFSPLSSVKTKLNRDLLAKRTIELQIAKEKLKNEWAEAKTRADSMLIKEREAHIQAAEMELEQAVKMLDAQDKEIKMQQKLLWISLGSIILLICFIGFVYFHYKEKKKTNLLLESKNKKITDSITYAKRIQESILVPEQHIQQYLPDFFVYFQPLDLVSGDFYWFSKVDQKIIIACVDCTGHGVPGAFMSLIGNTLLNEIVNEKKITAPDEILNRLHQGVFEALHQSEGDLYSQDGMELSVCVLDKEQHLLSFAGAMSTCYILHQGNLSALQGDIHSIGGLHYRPDMEKPTYTSKQIQFNSGTSLYLFTDGYMDQFGGNQNKKFNSSQFKQLLLSMEHMPMEEQKKHLASMHEQWKGNAKQTDDILVMGIRL